MNIDLAALKAAALAATPGPWHTPDRTYHAVHEDEAGEMVASAMCAADARHIALANPATILQLVERVRRLEAVAAAIRVVDDDLSVLEVQVPYQGSYVSGKCEEWQAVRAALAALDDKNKETKQ